MSEGGLLTPTQRAYLRGETDYDNRQTAYRTRRQIRERARQTLVTDLPLLADEVERLQGQLDEHLTAADFDAAIAALRTLHPDPAETPPAYRLRQTARNLESMADRLEGDA